MYRIRSASGAEAVYNSLEEFHAAVRRGEVHQEDEIFHTRANRWLDVKSHPHYRSAVGWNGGESHPLPPAPPAATTVRPAPAAPVRAEAAHPVAPPQTVVRPQLVADRPAPAPVAQAPDAPEPPRPAGPPRKSRELVFVDLGDPKPAAPPKQNVTIIEAQKPAAVTVQKPAAQQPRPVGNTEPGTELGFLVMDGGIESPVRNSAGHRIVAEDLNLLFDAPMPPGQAPAGGVATAAPPAPPVPPKTSAPARPAAPAPTPEPPPRPSAPVAKVTAPKVEPVKPAPSAAPAASAGATEVRPAAAKIAPPVAPPAPAPAPAPKPMPEPPAAVLPRPEPVAAPPAPAPVAAAPAPVVEPPAPIVVAPAVEDLDVPSHELVAAQALPVEPAAPQAASTAARSTRKGMLVGAGAFIIVMGVAVAAWKPWLRQAPPPPPQPEASTTVAAAPEQPAAAPATSEPATPAGRTANPASTAPRASEPQARADSVVPAAHEQVIAAAKPNFSAGVDVGAASLSLGADLPGTAAAVAPTELIRRLEQAEQQAQRDFTSRLGSFRSVLSPELIGTSEGAARARTAWGNGAEAIRQFRARIARLEQAYQDSVLSSQRTGHWPSEEMRAWSARSSAVEPAETTQLADLMVAQVGEGLDLLAGLGNDYSLKGGKISFTNAGSAPRYLSIRSWVEQRMSAWRATPESARPVTLTLLLTALGDGFPAVQ